MGSATAGYQSNRHNRSMAQHVSNRNFQRKRSKIRDSNIKHREPQPIQFGSNSERRQRRKREKSGLIATIIVVIGITYAVTASLLK